MSLRQNDMMKKTRLEECVRKGRHSAKITKKRKRSREQKKVRLKREKEQQERVRQDQERVKVSRLQVPLPAEFPDFIHHSTLGFKPLRRTTAASQWFQLFARAAKDFGLDQDVMQPTLLMKTKEIYITVHVDDVFMVGKEKNLRAFVNYLKEEMKWSVEEKGPFRSGETFHYLKRKFVLYDEWCDIRCDYRQY